MGFAADVARIKRQPDDSPRQVPRMDTRILRADVDKEFDDPIWCMVQ